MSANCISNHSTHHSTQHPTDWEPYISANISTINFPIISTNGTTIVQTIMSTNNQSNKPTDKYTHQSTKLHPFLPTVTATHYRANIQSER